MISNVAKAILRILGWKIVGNVPKEIKKAVIIMAPHTSNWDFVRATCLTGIKVACPILCKKRAIFLSSISIITWYRWRAYKSRKE